MPPSGIVTFVFTDIVGSTRMTAAVGDRAYVSHLLGPHNDYIQDVCDQHDGFVVKQIGDAFMLAFQRTNHALAFAAAIQERPGLEAAAVRRTHVPRVEAPAPATPGGGPILVPAD